ncbi:hypothetical protein LXA43DRAFT_322879 [Ganoderma leucocontextum]|nr:hypothetical protein LXA43DRAFT_322879 [Ganoderma leucocontextum]
MRRRATYLIRASRICIQRGLRITAACASHPPYVYFKLILHSLNREQCWRSRSGAQRKGKTKCSLSRPTTSRCSKPQAELMSVCKTSRPLSEGHTQRGSRPVCLMARSRSTCAGAAQDRSPSKASDVTDLRRRSYVTCARRRRWRRRSARRVYVLADGGAPRRCGDGVTKLEQKARDNWHRDARPARSLPICKALYYMYMVCTITSVGRRWRPRIASTDGHIEQSRVRCFQGDVLG